MGSVARGRGSSTVASKGLRMASRSLGADERVKTMSEYKMQRPGRLAVGVQEIRSHGLQRIE